MPSDEYRIPLGVDGRIRAADLDREDVTRWANETPERQRLLLDDTPQAVAQYLADRSGLAIVGREVDGDDLVAAVPDPELEPDA